MGGQSKRKCSVDDCEHRVHTRGLCEKHHHRLERNGDPLALAKAPYGEPARWLRAHANHNGDDCLIWPFGRAKSGYGHDVVFDGERGTPHRLMCKLVNGPPPVSEIRIHAAHSCGRGTSGCVHPKHLRWATAIQNAADAAFHGAAPRGERHGASKLTEDDVRAIRALRGVLSQQKVATRFGVTVSTINGIQLRKSWAHVT